MVPCESVHCFVVRNYILVFEVLHTVFMKCGGNYKNLTTVFSVAHERQSKGTELGVREAPPLYSLLRKNKVQRGWEE